MGKGEWVAFFGIAITLVTAGIAGWTANEARISTLESHAQDEVRARARLVNEILELTKELHELKGMHEKHVQADTGLTQ